MPIKSYIKLIDKDMLTYIVVRQMNSGARVIERESCMGERRATKERGRIGRGNL